MKKKNKRVSPLHRKRHGLHQKRSDDFLKTYHPFLPLLSVLIFIVAIFSFRPIKSETPKTGVKQNAVLAFATNISQNGLLSSTNQRRVAAGVGNLTINAQLNQAAQAKANDMATRNYWAHNTPEGNPPWIFFTNAGYSYNKAGENLACGFDESTDLITGWYNSPAHRANLLDADFKDVGFGIANADGYNCGSYPASPQTIVVAMYGTPYTDNIAPTPSPSPSPSSNPSNPKTKSSGGSSNNTPASPSEPTYDTHQVVLTILNFDGTPSKNTKVTMHSTPRTAYTDNNGVVSFDGVESGDHKVEVDISGTKADTSINIEAKEQVYKLSIVKPELGTNRTSFSSNSKDKKPSSKIVSRLNLLAQKYTPWVLSGMIILSILGVAFVLIKHSIAAHKFFIKGEQYVLKHKLVDVAVILLLIALYFLTKSVGVIL